MARKTQRGRPTLEGLEERLLMTAEPYVPSNQINPATGRPVYKQDLILQQNQPTNTTPPEDRQFSYTTADGARVKIVLYGLGTLKGTFVDAGGALHIIYDGTTVVSRIVGHVKGGSGRAPLAEIRDSDVTPRDAVIAGSNPVNSVNLKQFDLVPGGYISLSGGMNQIWLASAGPDTQVHLTDALNSAANTGTTAETASNEANIGGVASVTGTAATGGFGGGVGTGGAQVVGGNTGGAVSTGTAKPPPAPATGVIVQIPEVNAGPLGTPPLQSPQIYGYSPATGLLTRFDATTGAVTQAIPVANAGTPMDGVGLGRNNDRLVALVGSGSTVQAYDVVTGAPAGQFSTANLAAIGMTSIDGVGSTDARTVLTDASANPQVRPNGQVIPTGLAVVIDVTASLRTGQAVTIGSPFAPAREFEMDGGATGIPGSDTIFINGAGHFDTAQPDRVQLGVLGFSVAGSRIVEVGRLAVPGVGTPSISVGAPGVGQTLNVPLGSIDSDLAMGIGVVGSRYVVALFNPSTLVADGTLLLDTSSPLVGLSESFHPELLGAALIDVRGNIKKFVGQRASGLVINGSGNINLVAIHEATDTAVVGRPLAHVDIPIRRNVELLSTARVPTDPHAVVQAPGNRNGVTVNKLLRPAGPLSLP